MMTEERIAKLTSAVYKVTDLFPEKEPLKFVVRRESLDVLFSYVVLSSKSTFAQREKSVKKAIASSKSLIHYFSLAELQDWVDSQNFSILKTEYSNLTFWLEDQLLNLEIEVKKTFDNDYHIGITETEMQASPEAREKQAIPLEGGNGAIFSPPLKISARVETGKMRTKEARAKRIEKSPSETMERGEVKKERDLETKSDVVIDYEELSSIQLRTLEILQNKGFLKASQISQCFEDVSERSVRREIKELKDKSIIVSKGSGKSTFYELNHVY
jgi:DNA-binding transcriptional ArsR family regulator